jgi:lipid-A-disaccharide synthase
VSIFLSSGEASGDHYTASVARELRKLGYEGDIWGMGGKEPREAGVRVEWPGEELQLMGIAEVLTSIPSLYRQLNDMADRVMEEGPESVVIADSPDFNIPLIRKLRSRGYKGRVYYISPPSVWAWRSGRVKKIAAAVDECFPLFRFEHEFLLKNGCRSYWIGHPMTEEFADRDALARSLPEDLRVDERLVAFLPGSRGVEIKNLLPMMEKAASELKEKGWRPVFSIAPGLNEKRRIEMKEHLERNNLELYTGPGRDLLAASRCSVAASGTVAVEAMMLDCYMVALYRVSPLSAFVVRHLVRTKYYTIPNILLGDELFPELMQEEATPENIVRETMKWLEGGEDLKAGIYRKLELAREMLGETGVCESWAKRIMGAA